MDQKMPLSQPIADLLRKTIEQVPGKGECHLHHCPLPDVERPFGHTSIMTYGLCPQCVTEQQEHAHQRTQKEKLTLMAERVVRMGIPPRYRNKRIEDFRATTPAQHTIRTAALRFCRHEIDGDADEAVEQDAARPPIESLLLLGNVGTGKTLVACGILMDFTHERDGTWLAIGLYATAAQLMRRIKMTWKKDAEESEQDVLTKLTKPDLLVIDEIGVQFNSDTERVLLTELINDRYNAHQQTILVSNLTLKEFTQVVGERIVDRFREGGKVLVFDWPSERGRPSSA